MEKNDKKTSLDKNEFSEKTLNSLVAKIFPDRDEAGLKAQIACELAAIKDAALKLVEKVQAQTSDLENGLIEPDKLQSTLKLLSTVRRQVESCTLTSQESDDLEGDQTKLRREYIKINQFYHNNIAPKINERNSKPNSANVLCNSILESERRNILPLVLDADVARAFIMFHESSSIEAQDMEVKIEVVWLFIGDKLYALNVVKNQYGNIQVMIAMDVHASPDVVFTIKERLGIKQAPKKRPWWKF